MAERNYTLGRGRVLFARFTEDETPGRFRYVGNTPELNFNVESETLDHSDRGSGVTRIDDSVVLSVTRSGTMVMDDIQRDNLALFFFGSTSRQSPGMSTGQVQAEAAANQDDIVQIGISDTNRVGVRGVLDVVVKEGASLDTPTWAANGVVFNSAAGFAANESARDAVVKAASGYSDPTTGAPTVALYEYDEGDENANPPRRPSAKVTYMTWDGSSNWDDSPDNDTLVADQDYEIDDANGTVEFLFRGDVSDPAIPASGAAGADVNIFYNVGMRDDDGDLTGADYDQVISGSEPVEGAMRFVEDNPKGVDNQWVFPKVSIAPNGDVALKANEWRTIPFSLRILDPSSGDAIYINGEPVAA